jgi:Domain of unknown function (DUF4926)
MKYKLFSSVRLNQDLPEFNLKKGDIGIIVEYYNHLESEDGYSLEGLIPLDTVEVSESQIELVSQSILEKQTVLN